LAAQLTVKALANKGEIRYAPHTHPALWLGESPKNHLDFSNWATQVVDEINNSPAKNWVLLSNSMNNLFPEVYDFAFIKYINPDKQIVLIIDDSHGIGLLNGGNSAWQNLPQLPNVEIVLVASM